MPTERLHGGKASKYPTNHSVTDPRNGLTNSPMKNKIMMDIREIFIAVVKCLDSFFAVKKTQNASSFRGKGGTFLLTVQVNGGIHKLKQPTKLDHSAVRN